MAKTILQRFNEKINVTIGCWEWTGARKKDGYGYMNIGGKEIRAHRLSFTLHKGQIAENMQICHSCDNRLCVNPDHLWEGTTQQNTEDMCKKGRQAKGRRGITKLTESTVIEIRSSHVSRCKVFGIKPLAEKYGVSKTQIWNVLHHKKWA